MTAMAPRWAIRLTGDFSRPHTTHLLPCADETTARRRLQWWQSWRPDVIGVLQVRGERGLWAEPAPSADVLAGVA